MTKPNPFLPLMHKLTSIRIQIEVYSFAYYSLMSVLICTTALVVKLAPFSHGACPICTNIALKCMLVMDTLYGNPFIYSYSLLIPPSLTFTYSSCDLIGGQPMLPVHTGESWFLPPWKLIFTTMEIDFYHRGDWFFTTVETAFYHHRKYIGFLLNSLLWLPSVVNHPII